MNWKPSWKTWGLGLYAAAAVSGAQAGTVSEIPADKLDFQLIPMILDGKDIPPKNKAKYRQIELQREKPAEASEVEIRRFHVSKTVYLTQNDVEDVRVLSDALGQFALHIQLKSESKQKLRNLTQTFLGRQMIVMNREQGVYYSSAFVRDVLPDGILELGGGLASLKEAEHIANDIRRHAEFRGVDDGMQIEAEFEALDLKSAANEAEHSFKVWADKEKIIRSKDVDKLLIRVMEKGGGAEAEEFNKALEMYGDIYYAALILKDKGWRKLEGLQSAALVSKDNKFIKFIPDNGAESLQLEVFLDAEQKEQFLRKITK